MKAVLTILRQIAVGLIAAYFAFFLAFWLTTKALAHDAPASRQQPYGWTYDISCCNAYDCRQLSADEIEETPTGYIWRSKHSSAVHVYTHDERMDGSPGSKRIRRSQDEFYHGCESNQVPPRKLCLYVPDKAG